MFKFPLIEKKQFQFIMFKFKLVEKKWIQKHEKTTDLSQVTDKFYILQLFQVHCHLDENGTHNLGDNCIVFENFTASIGHLIFAN